MSTIVRLQHHNTCSGTLLQQQCAPLRLTLLCCQTVLPLLDSRPDLVEQWHPTRNTTVNPATVSIGSGYNAWWQCKRHLAICGNVHEWQATVYNRARRSLGCPICAGQRPCACNSLSTLRPDLAAEWDHVSNGPLKPEHVTVGSSKHVHWVCGKHGPVFTWRARVEGRTRGRGHTRCPKCADASRVVKQREHPLELDPVAICPALTRPAQPQDPGSLASILSAALDCCAPATSCSSVTKRSVKSSAWMLSGCQAGVEFG